MRKLLTTLLLVLGLTITQVNAQWIGCPYNNATSGSNTCACAPQTLLDESLHLYEGGPSYTINQFLISLCNASGQTNAFSTYATSYNQSLNGSGQAVWSGGCVYNGDAYGTDCVITPTIEGSFVLDWDFKSILAANASCYSYLNTGNFDEYAYWSSTGANANGAFDVAVTDFVFNLPSFTQVCKSNTLQLTSNLNMPNGAVTHTMTTTANATNALKFTTGVGYRFEAQLVPAGQYVVTCVGDFDNGQKSIQLTIEVVDDALTESPISLCSNAPLYDLSALYPYSGNFTGPGTTVNNATKTFNSAVAPIGSNTLSFAYTEPNSGCALSHNFNIDVLSAPNVNVTGNFSLCSDYGVIDLTTLVSPAGGTFSGTGVSGNNYIPDFAGVGTHTVTYSVTNAQGCTDSDSWDITVNPAVVVTAPVDQTICQDDGIQNYASMVSPLGGTFSGTGITTAGLFNPQTSGLGTTNVTYTYQNSYGCSDDSTFAVTVNPAVTITAPFGQTFCEDAGLQSLIGQVSPSGGTFSGPGITGSNFNPLFAGVGIHNVTYMVNNGAGCSDSHSWNITVNPEASVIVPNNMDVCIDNGIINFSAQVTPNPSSGIYNFTGPGMSGNGVFTPSTAGIGIHTLSYTYSNSSGCSDTKTWAVTVIPDVTVSTPPVLNFCSADGAYDLTTAPGLTPLGVGGVFSGTGVSGNNFIPSFAGVGTFPVTYTYTNAEGCSDMGTIQVSVNQTPTVTVPADFTICSDAAPIDLTTLVSPVSNSFIGTGVSNASFIPSVAGSGTYPITYTYTNANGCSASDSWNITVVDALNDSLDIGSDITICLTSSPVNLNATNSLTGGTYSGVGVIDTVFYPTQAGPGTHIIEYTISYNSCLLIADRTITVLDVPDDPQIVGDLEYCIDDETTLSVSNPELNIDYIWSINNTVINTGDNLNNYTVVGDETITVVGENIIGCLSNEVDVDIETLMPEGDIVASLTTINTGQLVNLQVDNEENVTGYTWNLGNGQSSSNASPNVYYYANDQDEEYTVSCVLTSSIGCETTITLNTTIYVIADIDTGTAIRSIQGLENLNIYPNPTNGIISIEFDYNKQNSLTAILQDVSGKVLISKELTNKSTLNLSEVSQGIYFLKLQDASTNQFIVHKIIKI